MSQNRCFIDQSGDFIWNDMRFGILKTKEQISERAKEVAQEISKDLKGKQPVFLCILNGSFLWLSDVVRELDWFDFCIEFMRFSSYSNNEQSGQVKQLVGLDAIKCSLKDRHVVIFEDIIDSGLTLNKVIELINSQNPASVKTCSFLIKPSKLKYDIKCDYTGFEIGPDFVVGYGLDVDEQARNLKDLYALKKE